MTSRDHASARARLHLDVDADAARLGADRELGVDSPERVLGSDLRLEARHAHRAEPDVRIDDEETLEERDLIVGHRTAS